MLQNELKRKGGVENKRDKKHKDLLEETKTYVQLDNIFMNVKKKKKGGNCRVSSLKVKVII
jgi:hypothetical protein